MADGSGPTLNNRRRIDLVLQAQSAERAIACLPMIARYYGHDIDLPFLRRRHDSSLMGATLGELIEAARSLSFETRALRVSEEAA